MDLEPNEEAAMYLNYGDFYMSIPSDQAYPFQKAREFYEKAGDIVKGTGGTDFVNDSVLSYGMGLSYEGEGEICQAEDEAQTLFRKAVQYYDAAIPLFEK